MIGRTLSHYKILEKIGAGGMGEVYLAEDTKLDRKVALKVLPTELAENEERRARFQREAKAIAALDHPNIVQVFSVEEAEGIHFITMQLVRGKTLGELLPKNGLPLNKFFDIAIPLADAVAAAHQEGITHRDLKPDNVMVGDDGRVKVLDFGLAKPTSGFVAGNVESAAPTVAKTAEGVIVGTVGYMSPEQAQGKGVDARSDVFSTGVVLYEMLTGRRPFGGETPAEVVSSIIKETAPPAKEVRRDIPRELSRMVQRCLAKEPTRRIQTALDVRNELEDIRQDNVEASIVGESSVAERTSTVRINRWLAGTTLALIAVVLGLLSTRDTHEQNLRLANAIRVTSAAGVEDFPTWSPDAGRVAFESNQRGDWDIWVSQINGGQAVNLTEDHLGPDRYPSWSPDGAQIAFVSQREQRWSLYTVPAIGGSSRRVLALPAEAYESSYAAGAPQWSPDGSQVAVFTRDSDGRYITLVTLETLEQQSLSLPNHEGKNSYHLSWSPDGNLFAYSVAIHAAAQHELWLLPFSTQTPFRATDPRLESGGPAWSSNARDLFFVSNRGGIRDLWRQPLDGGGKPEGPASSVSVGLEVRSASFSRDGRKVAISRGRRLSNLWRVPILEGERASWGDAEQLTFDNAHVGGIDISPDGKRLVLKSDRAGHDDLWTVPTDGGDLEILVQSPSTDSNPVWTPNGREVLFDSDRSGNTDIWEASSDGGPARQLTFDLAEDSAPSAAPDGSAIAFVSRRGGGRDIWVRSEDGELRQVTTHPAIDYFPDWSPDGEWIVFHSWRGGRLRLWRTRADGSGEPEKISNGPGIHAIWSPDGDTIYFVGWDERAGNLWALSLANGREYSVTNLVGRRGTIGYNLATDGQFLYFPWWEDRGDIWVMDVVTDEES